jgi:tetratricopeptide (TPR) repeat protein
MMLVSPRLGLALSFELIPGIFAGGHVDGGYYFGFRDSGGANSSGQYPLFNSGISLDYRPIPSLSIGIDASYRYFFGLYNDIVLNLGLSYHFLNQKNIQIIGEQMKPFNDLVIKDLSLGPIFPVFFKYYDNNQFGKVKIRNNGKVPLENVKVKTFIKDYMDNPKVCAQIEFLKGGTEQEIPLYALFNEKVLDITEATKVQLNIIVESTVAGENYGNQSVDTVRIYDRNAMTWEDDRRAAAFVTFKDPNILRFAKNVKAMVADKAPKAISDNFLTAMVYHLALVRFGIKYAVDPKTPFTEFFKKKVDVDYLQFPSQTLDYGSGDCDDLSILYASLLESVGIEAAFITIPGHIFIAFSLNLSADNAKKQFYNTDDLIFTDTNEAWCPLEVTVIGTGFLDAWQTGAKEWRDARKAKAANFYPLSDAWKIYEPVGFAGEPLDKPYPDARDIVSDFTNEVKRFLDIELYPRVDKLAKKIQESQGNENDVNSLGVLYARYGIYDKAEEQFAKIVAKKEFVPALVNMGNIAFLKQDYTKARDYYERAYKKEPSSATVLVNLAKTWFEIPDYAKADDYYKRLAKADKALADQYKYLSVLAGDQTTRASDAKTKKEVMVWGE